MFKALKLNLHYLCRKSSTHGSEERSHELHMKLMLLFSRDWGFKSPIFINLSISIYLSTYLSSIFSSLSPSSSQCVLLTESDWKSTVMLKLLSRSTESRSVVLD